MSVSLLQRVHDHLAAATPSLLRDYAVRFYRWVDSDMKSGQIILFNLPGTYGPGAHVIQRPDVSIQILCNPDQVTAGDARMLSILQYFRLHFEIMSDNGNAFNAVPLGHYDGPRYLQNNRALFDLRVRCMVEDM